MLALVLVTWMVAAVGVNASIRATSTSKALTSTIATLVVLCGYPGFLLWAFLDWYNWDRYYATFVGLPARIAVGPLVSYAYFSGSWTAFTRGGFWQPRFGLVIVGTGLTLIYSLVAATLTLRALARFDAWLDRPRLSEESPMAGKPARPIEEIEPELQSWGGKTSGSTW
jgi:hypothetical protein